ncbi:hypothetical protein JAAARDRAFT_36754 [Jaapia argillacea MUCL 33604]|uniref:Extracellular membrane protein CFEM domain-containing protein n=1 Tax=Jaapia argillacea MUCL 33604 TaxID=933084 RepID=A0A067PMG0_9AGAM|nr:hypothetical protein JAAARDRAFT_36754 [Jaapia argillacea MUCL 33604]
MGPHAMSLIAVLLIFINLSHLSHASPFGSPIIPSLTRRTDPYFPDDPPSCPICAQSYLNISSCCQAAPILANFSAVIFNPGAFIAVIKCACTDTFQSVFPQCVDCFIQTNQSDILSTPNLPAVVSGMRQVCALESTLLGGVATADGEVTPTSTGAAPTSTSTSSAKLGSIVQPGWIYMLLGMGGIGLVL